MRSETVFRVVLKNLVAAALLSVRVSAGPFQPDRDTLLLAGFDRSVREADYAAGPVGFYGCGATFAPGYYGKGIDLRGRSLTPDFQKTAEDGRSAIFSHMALFTFGNLLPDEGTLEMFVLVENFPKNPEPNHGFLLNAFVGRFIEDGKSYQAAQMRLSRGRLEWRFPLWSGDNRDQWSGRLRFKPALKTGWHHIAVTWAQGEAVLYLDGRAAASCDLGGKYGLTIFHHLNHGVHLGGHVIDELRISSVARYRGDFEPNWRDGRRPAYAYEGGETVKRYPATYRPSPDGRLETASELPGIDAATVLLEGLERRPMTVKWQTGADGKLHGDCDGKLAFRGDITPLDGGNGDRIDLVVRNTGKADIGLECLLAVPPLPGEKQVFDGADIKAAPAFASYRDSYNSILPLTAAAGGSEYRAVALDPGFPYNDLITARTPGKGSAQGTRFLLAPGEEFAVHFVTFRGRSRFGVAAALDEYYRIFRKYYHIDRSNTVYHFLPLTMHWRGFLPADLQRQGCAGGYWGHGPYHTKGDETGRFWGKHPEDPSFKHALGNEKTFKSPEQLREAIRVEYRYEYDNGYAVRRYHANPDLTATWLIRELLPAWVPKDDPLNTGHYYKRNSHQYFVNEYENPFSRFFAAELRRYYEAGMKDFSTGWINDTIYATAAMRYNGPETAKVPGRSFSRDFGPFIRGAMGKQQRWEYIGKLTSRGYPMTMIADGGSFSYTLGAFSAQSALESGSIFESLPGWNFLKNARYLHGEKPLSMHTLPEKIETARRIRADGIDPMKLRDAYNINTEHTVLFALEHALYLDPTAYLPGKQYLAEMTPLLVDAVLRGRKAVPAAEFSGKGWVRRSGSGAETLLVCGNPAGAEARGALKVFRECFDGRAPLLAPYFGGTLAQEITAEATTFPVAVPPRRAAAFLTVALADHAERSAAELTGDGIDVRLKLNVDAARPGTLELAGFGPLYDLVEVRVNGKKTAVANRIALIAGNSTVEARWHCRTFLFTAREWAKVRLLNGQNPPDFTLVADRGWRYRKLFYNLTLGYEHGTAAMFEDFVRAYDAEDGIYRNMPLPEWSDRIDPAEKRWQIVFDGHAKRDGVELDLQRKLIRISGTTPGSCRRQAVVFLRLMDRRHPHVGVLLPSRKQRFDRTTGIQPGMFREKKVYEFFRTLSEPDFLFKPLLKSESYSLYDGGTTDFSGKYPIAAPPFIFEPTYADDFVYGFSGETPEWREFIRRVGTK
ncbi:MAG: LamG domain-containing protein [Lentisphaeria bacterium]|nr:LamG domain-containing protein [Lentisphaeria bacterium]